MYNNFPFLHPYWNRQVFDRSAPYLIILYQMIRSPYFLYNIAWPVVCLPVSRVPNLPAQTHWDFRNLLNYVVSYRLPLPIEYWLFGWRSTMWVALKLSTAYELRNVIHKSKAMREIHVVLKPGSIQVTVMFTFLLCYRSGKIFWPGFHWTTQYI